MAPVLLCALALAADDSASAREGVEQTFRRWESLVARQDVAGMAHLMHPSGYTVSLDGSRWPFSRAKQDLPELFKGRRKMTMRVTIDRFSYGGGEAVAWITTVARYEEKVEGRWVRKTTTSRDADTLLRFGDHWKFIYSQQLP